MPELTITAVDPTSVPALEILREYYAELVGRYYDRAATTQEVEATMRDEPSDDLDGETGFLLVASNDEGLLGCGGVRFVDGTLGEVTRIFVRPVARGAGVGALILSDLEERARSAGRTELRLDTRSDLVEARRLYERLGYREVAAFNQSIYAQHWFLKQL